MEQQLLLDNFIHKNKRIYLNAKQIYLPNQKTILSDALNDLGKVKEQNKQLLEIIASLQDRISSLEEKRYSNIPSWAEATPAQISSTLTSYYNGDITLDDIPWKVGDQKIINVNADLWGLVHCNRIILTILDKDKIPAEIQDSSVTKAAFTIGLQAKGYYYNSSKDTNLELLKSIGNPSPYNDYDFNQIRWDEGSYAWNAANVTDNDTYNALIEYYNASDLLSILALRVSSLFDANRNEYRTIIPCRINYMDYKDEECLEFFKQHMLDYGTYIEPDNNWKYGYNFIKPYSNQ